MKHHEEGHVVARGSKNLRIKSYVRSRIRSYLGIALKRDAVAKADAEAAEAAHN